MKFQVKAITCPAIEGIELKTNRYINELVSAGCKIHNVTISERYDRIYATVLFEEPEK